MSIVWQNKWLKLLLIVFSLGCAGTLGAEVFTSKDNRFTIDLPSGWSQTRTTDADVMISVVKGTSRLDIKSVPNCQSESCIEQKIQADLLDVKNKKMQVVGNTYTGEEIKRIDFSTGEPFFYISFFTPKNDFSSGYFLIGKNAYSILAKDLSYAQTDLIFSFISPTQEPPVQTAKLEIDLADTRAYDIDALPAVSEEALPAPLPISAPQQKTKPTKNTIKLKLPRTLVTPNMPPYIKQLGRGFDILVLLLFLYLLVNTLAAVIRFFISAKIPEDKINPNSPYPLRFCRLYGTPALIFRARDNQGNVLISLSPRWDSLFLFGGLIMMICAVFVMAFTGILESTQFIKFSSFAYNTVYSAVSLIIPLGFVIFICGLLWSLLVLRQFALYDNKGQKAVYIMQRGFGISKEHYLIYFAKSKELLIAERKRFSLLRHWQLLNKERQILAQIQEENIWTALIRKFTGHLWGLLRASYTIEGTMDSHGKICNTRQALNRFITTIDKPQAISSRDLLVASLIVNIRDRDKWYPWF